MSLVPITPVPLALFDRLDKVSQRLKLSGHEMGRWDRQKHKGIRIAKNVCGVATPVGIKMRRTLSINSGTVAKNKVLAITATMDRPSRTSVVARLVLSIDLSIEHSLSAGQLKSRTAALPFMILSDQRTIDVESGPDCKTRADGNHDP